MDNNFKKHLIESDKEEYIVKKNSSFLKWYDENIKYVNMPLSTIQTYIDLLAYSCMILYERFGDKYNALHNVLNNEGIPDDLLRLLIGFYRTSHVHIHYDVENFDIDVSFDMLDGQLEKNKLIENIFGINTTYKDIVYLYRFFEKNKFENFDYSELTDLIEKLKFDFDLKLKIYELVTLKILYNKTNTDDAYIMAKQFVKDVNNMHPNMILSTYNIDQIMLSALDESKKYKK